MAEVGFDLSDRKPKRVDLEMQLHADLGVTLACGGVCPYVPAAVEDWDVEDPHGKSLEEVRAIRDEIERCVQHLIEERADEIRADRSAHEFRLARILPPLVEEFEAQHSPEEIRACADAILDRYDGVAVRSFVLTLATRDARACLREETCAALV